MVQRDNLVIIALAFLLENQESQINESVLRREYKTGVPEKSLGIVNKIMGLVIASEGVLGWKNDSEMPLKPIHVSVHTSCRKILELRDIFEEFVSKRQ